jgi:hypothetical protein
MHTLTFQPHIFPEQLSVPLDPIADHVYQADTVGKQLHIATVTFDVGKYQVRMNERWKSVGMQQHAGI